MTDQPVVLTVDDLTLGELADLAGVAGDDVLSQLSEKRLTPSALIGLVWIIRRRDDPTFTVEDARQVKVAALEVADG